MRSWPHATQGKILVYTGPAFLLDFETTTQFYFNIQPAVKHEPYLRSLCQEEE